MQLPNQARLLAVLLALASQLSSAAGAQTFALQGTVLRPDGSGLPSASVELVPVPTNFEIQSLLLAGRTPGAVATAATDGGGRYALEAPEAGLWRLRVSAPGFVAMTLPTLPLVESAELPPVRLRRAVDAPISVVDPRGRLLAGAGVYAYTADTGLWADEDGGWRAAPRFGWTGDGGRLSLPRARGERLDLWARLPGRLAVGEAKAVRGARIVMPRIDEPVRSLVLSSTGGGPEAGAMVAWAGRPWPLGVTSEDGSLELHGRPPPDTEIILFSRDGRARKLHIEPGDEPLRIDLPPAVRLAGRVVDDTGRPLAGAMLWPAHDPAAFVLAGDDGRYVLPTAALPRIRLQAQAAGFLAHREIVTPGPSGGPVDFRLNRGHVLAGRVVDEAGRPVAGARLAATAPREMRPPAWRFDPVDARAVSAGDGGFELRGLVPGTPHELVATGDGEARARQRVTASDGDAIEVVLRRGRPAFGRVLDQDERPVAGAEVRLRPAAGTRPAGNGLELREEPPPARADDRGRFEVRAVLGERVDLLARSSGFAPLTVRGVRVPVGDGAVDLGTLILVPGVSLSGRVTDPDGEPVAGAGVWRADDRRETSRHPDATADGDGRFLLADLEPRRELELRVDAAGFLPAAVAGVVPPVPQPLAVTLERAGRLRGAVVDEDGAPVAGAEISAEPLEPAALGAAATGVSDAEGRFDLDRVAPGVVDVGVYSPEFQPAPARRLELAPGQEIAGLRFVLIRGSVLEGRVTNDGEGPVAGARILVGRAADHSRGDGGFRVAGIPPGRRHVEVRHPEYHPHRQELEISDGVQQVDFELRPGHEVTGRVVDLEELPLAGVALALESLDGAAAGGRAARSGDDGAFRFPRVPDGRYRLRAGRRGYVAAGPAVKVKVAGGPVADLEVRLRSGARISGRILGLGFEDLARVEVRAMAEERRPRPGEVDFEGRYEIPDLPPDDWQVVAALDGGSRRARARVTLAPEDGAVERDLSFDGGLVLTGVVRYGGEPLPATRVTVRGLELPVERGVATGPGGRFRVENLEPGSYHLGLANHHRGVIHNQSLDVAGDRDLEIDVATAQVSGSVLEAGTGRPVPAAMIRLQQELPDGRQGSLFARPGDDGGEFLFPRLAAGRYRLSVQHEGYQPVELPPLEVPAGTAVGGVRVELRAAAGLELLVALASGRRPRFITVHARDAAGRTYSETRMADAEGYARFSTLPTGRWHLTVGGSGGAAVEVQAEVPREPLAVVLPDAGRLRVRIPRLTGDDSVATLTVADPAGRPFRQLKRTGALEETWPVVAGRATVEGLPAGLWTVTAQAPSGETWTGTAATTGGPDVEVALE